MHAGMLSAQRGACRAVFCSCLQSTNEAAAAALTMQHQAPLLRVSCASHRPHAMREARVKHCTAVRRRNPAGQSTREFMHVPRQVCMLSPKHGCIGANAAVTHAQCAHQHACNQCLKCQGFVCLTKPTASSTQITLRLHENKPVPISR
jgi:hypothetical protein